MADAVDAVGTVDTAGCCSLLLSLLLSLPRRAGETGAEAVLIDWSFSLLVSLLCGCSRLVGTAVALSSGFSAYAIVLVGASVGAAEGEAEGVSDGGAEGASVGATLGEGVVVVTIAVGADDGEGVERCVFLT